MTKLNMKEWSNNILTSKKRLAMPLMTHPGIEITGSTVKDACSNGQTQFESIKALHDKYKDSIGFTAIMDLTTEAEAFGAEISAPDDEVASVIGRLLNNDDDINALQVPSLDKGRVPEYLKAIRLATEYITDKPFFGGCIGPFSLAGRLYDMSEIMMLIYINPDMADVLLGKCTSFITDYCLAMKKTGANGVIMAEPAAGLLSNEDCERFSSLFVKKIVDKVQDDSFMVILHNCGNTGHCTKAMVATGAAALHFGNKADMAVVLKDVPGTVLAMGNIDPVSSFKMGTPDDMKTNVGELLNKTKNYDNFVLSSGCDTPPHSPLANIDAFFQALNDFNR